MRPEDRPQHRALAAQHHHHDHLDGEVQPKGLPWLDVAVLEEEEHPDHAREDGRQHIGPGFGPGRHHPHHLGGVFVLADGHQAQTELAES